MSSPLRLRRLVPLLLVAALALILSGTQRTYAQESTFFPETGHTVSGLFLHYWQDHGALPQQGYPISEEFQEKSDLNGQVYTVQYFERAVFELHPENQPPYDVLLSQLGKFRYDKKYPGGAPNQTQNKTNGNFFPQTNHWVGGKFWQYWQAHGGLAQQGYPLSDEFTEVSDLNHQPYTVQYFERAVFELHPENQPPYDVLLSQLGKFQYQAKYGSGSPTNTPAPSAPTATPTNTPAPANPPAAPALVSPANGAVLRVSPRVATFNWNPVDYSGGVAYNIEIQVNTGDWQPFANQSNLTNPTYTMGAFPGDNQGRWRVSATANSGPVGPWSDWRTFSFNTGADQYSGTWLNEDTNTGGVAKLWISNSGQTLNVHWFGACGGGFCDNGSESKPYGGEPFVVVFAPPGFPTHEFTITLDDDAGTRLKVVDVGSASGTNTYYFRRATAAMYDGVWDNVDGNTGGVVRLVISHTGETLTVHWYGACSPNPCDNGSQSKEYKGEPFTILFAPPGFPTHEFTITFDNIAGTRLKVVDVGSSSGTHTYYFSK